MSVELPYLEEEAEWIGGWPPSPPDEYGPSQYSTLGEELKRNVREWAIREGISPRDYWKPITEAKELFDGLRNWMNYSDHMTEEQKKAFDTQCFWYHKELYEAGLTDRKQAVWPMVRDALIADVRQYLEKPEMWSKPLDYLLTDALIYAEIAAFRESFATPGFLLWVLGGEGPWYVKLFAFLLKWSAILLVLGFAHEVSRELFVVLAICVIAYQIRKSLAETPLEEKVSLYTEMVGVYNCCDYRRYNASMIWEMCASAREKGAVFDGVLYDLLEKQRAQNHEYWRARHA